MRIWRPVIIGFQAIIVLVLAVGASVIGAATLPGGAWWGLLPAVVGIALLARKPLRRWRVARRTFPQERRDWLADRVPFYAQLGESERRRFERDVQFFLSEQRFEGVKGASLTDELRLSVAAGAALLLHGRPDWEWPTRRTILVYPDRFDDTYHKSAFASLDGMIHAQGPIIFSKKAIEKSWSDAHDGDNVVLHEMAHVFDTLREGASGTPSFLNPRSAESWRGIVQEEMEKASRGSSLLRPYAASSPGELFAVAVENFFEKPGALADRHSELYEALSAFFNLDPRPVEEGMDV